MTTQMWAEIVDGKQVSWKNESKLDQVQDENHDLKKSEGGLRCRGPQRKAGTGIVLTNRLSRKP